MPVVTKTFKIGLSADEIASIPTKTSDLTNDGDGNGSPYTTKDYVDNLALSYLVYKGTKTVAQINALDTSTLQVGWYYTLSNSGTITLGNVQVVAGDNVIWNGSTWDKILSNLVTVDTHQTITGSKTFTTGISVTTTTYDNKTGEVGVGGNGGNGGNRFGIIDVDAWSSGSHYGNGMMMYAEGKEDNDNHFNVQGVIDFEEYYGQYGSDGYYKYGVIKHLKYLDVGVVNYQRGFIGTIKSTDYADRNAYYKDSVLFLPTYPLVDDQWDNPYPNDENGNPIEPTNNNTLATKGDTNPRLATIKSYYYDSNLEIDVDLTFNDILNGYYTDSLGNRVDLKLNSKVYTYPDDDGTSNQLLADRNATFIIDDNIDDGDNESSIFLVNVYIEKGRSSGSEYIDIFLRFRCLLPEIRNDIYFYNVDVFGIYEAFKYTDMMYAGRPSCTFSTTLTSIIKTQNLRKYYPYREFIVFNKKMNAFGWLNCSEEEHMVFTEKDTYDDAITPYYTLGMLITNHSTRTTKGSRVGTLLGTRSGNRILYTSQDILTKYGSGQSNHWILRQVDYRKAISVEDVLKLFEGRTYDHINDDRYRLDLTTHQDKYYYAFDHVVGETGYNDYLDMLNNILGQDVQRFFKTGTTPRYNKYRCCKFNLKFVNNLVRENNNHHYYWSGIMANSYLDILIGTTNRVYNGNNLVSFSTVYVLIPRRFTKK